MSGSLRPWPNKADYTFEHVWCDMSGSEIVEPPQFDEHLYAIVLADAAMERLRVAMETLQRVEDLSALNDWTSTLVASSRALAVIGPLPPHPGE